MSFFPKLCMASGMILWMLICGVAVGQLSPDPKDHVFIIEIKKWAGRFGKNMAHEIATQCHTNYVHNIDKAFLDRDITNCTLESFKKLMGREDAHFLHYLLHSNRTTELETIMSSVLSGQLLTAGQKEELTTTVLQPICSAREAMLAECQSSEYTELEDAAKRCGIHSKYRFDENTQEYLAVILDDICEEDAVWILDYLDSGLMKCASGLDSALKSEEWETCFGLFWNIYYTDGTFTFADTKEEFCNNTRTFLDCLLSAFVTSCPGPGSILLHIFSNSSVWWSDRCLDKVQVLEEEGPLLVQQPTPEPAHDGVRSVHMDAGNNTWTLVLMSFILLIMFVLVAEGHLPLQYLFYVISS